jgi:hypothetical protein
VAGDRRIRGFTRQQLVKLAFAAECPARFCITFDSDVVLLRPLDPTELVFGRTWAAAGRGGEGAPGVVGRCRGRAGPRGHLRAGHVRHPSGSGNRGGPEPHWCAARPRRRGRLAGLAGRAPRRRHDLDRVHPLLPPPDARGAGGPAACPRTGGPDDPHPVGLEARPFRGLERSRRPGRGAGWFAVLQSSAGLSVEEVRARVWPSIRPD